MVIGGSVFCSSCGYPHAPGAAFCDRCAAPLGAPAAEAPVGRRTGVVVAAVTAAVVLVAGAAVGGVLAARHGGRRGPSQLAAQAPLAAVASATAVPASTPRAATSTPSPTSSGFTAIYANASPAVVRIDATTCDGSGVGTGFLLRDGLVATVAHVVSGAVAIGLTSDSAHVGARIVGEDDATDLALLRPSTALSGTGLVFTAGNPAIGDPVAAIGYPLGEPKTLSTGAVSGLNRTEQIDGTSRSGLIQTDAPVNPGNSGGPLLDSAGHVVGLVDAKDTGAEGLAWAVDGPAANAEFADWAAHPNPVPPGSCSDPLGPSQGAAPALPGGGASDGGLSALETYFAAINRGDYATAFAQMDAHATGGSTESQFAQAEATTFDQDFRVVDESTPSPTTEQVQLDFTSLQGAGQGPNGDTCDNWTLLYTLIQQADGTWLIDSASGVDGSTHSSC